MEPLEKNDFLILVVDDDPLISAALKISLENEGFHIITAADGPEALAILKQQAIAVIICDQHMPGMEGLEVLIQARTIQPKTIRIVLTGYDDVEKILQLINVGQVSQYIQKPWDHTSLVQIVSASLERYKLEIENKRLFELTLSQHAELKISHEKLQNELILGSRIHQVLLSGVTPGKVCGLAFAAQSIPSEMIDGDFYDFYRPADHLVDFVMGDVMGKGLPAALIGTAVITQLKRFAMPISHLNLFNKEDFWYEQVLPPEEILRLVHFSINSQLIDLEHFVCLVYGRFDLNRRTFSYIDCGSTKPFRYSAETKSIEILEGKNFPLGVAPTVNSYPVFHVPYNLNDIFLFYSDGITQARSPTGEFFGEDKLEQILKNHSHVSAEELLKIVKTEVFNFTKKESLDDDFTIIIVKVEEISNPVQDRPPVTAKFARDLTQQRAVRQFIKKICAQAPGDVQQLTNKLELAINEIFCNSVKHGGPQKEDQEIIICAQYTQNFLVIEIADNGVGFDPSSIAQPSLSGDRDSGFGIYMIQELVDGISYKRKETPDGWNHIRIKKQYITNETTMDVSYTTEDNVMILTLDGEQLDAKEAQDFKQKVIDLISTVNVDKVIFDIHKLTFIDSSGLGVFLSLMRFLNARGGELKIANMTKPIRAVFELVCMHKIFDIYNTTEEAMSSFKP